MDYIYFWQDILANKHLIISTLGGLSGVYLIVNTINGNSYVGSSAYLVRRLTHHFYGHCSNPHLQHAFNKYGLNNFYLIILAIVPPIR
jgi:group I intron endonuclease